MDDAADVVDVDAASGDVGGDERLRTAVDEGPQRPVALGLRAAAVDGDRATRRPLRAERRRGRRRAWCGRTRSSTRASATSSAVIATRSWRRARHERVRRCASPSDSSGCDLAPVRVVAGTAARARRCRRRASPRTAASGGRVEPGRGCAAPRGGSPCRPCGRLRRSTTISTSSRSTSPRRTRSAEPAGAGDGDVDAAVAAPCAGGRSRRRRRTTPTLRLRAASRGRSSAWIWAASSRVGASTRARGPARRGPG